MKKIKAITVMLVMCGLTGCATANKDPLEGINRGIYKFNDVADRYAMQPVAKAYKTVAPSPVRTGISNFFSNLGTLTTVVNDLLQLKFAQAFTDAGRFVINSTFGLAGFIDVASMDKIEKHNEDFGQTLGHWGVGPGAYLVLPILGPSTVRDAGGLVVDVSTSDPITYLHNIGEVRTYNQVRAVQLLDRRTQLLDATDLVDNASIDPYAFMRDAYLQRRASLVQDGLVPKELLQDDFEPADDEPADQPAQSQEDTADMPAVVLLQSDSPIADEVVSEQQPSLSQSEDALSIGMTAIEEAAPASTDALAVVPDDQSTSSAVEATTSVMPADVAGELQLPAEEPVHQDDVPTPSASGDVLNVQSAELSVKLGNNTMDETEAAMVAAIDETLLVLEATE
ncbi:MlaA family lipoprotein [Methylophilus aquaticus]|uniref:VacJ family lipoprotein n=1 Tax=Methylophilus aquaticus TaxID=1971610 RepID=A0ABT9JQN7_9PROT|nr:VacJ family lipoprotein [Methylophilus aquaticus]MDP8566872.1 VacJ family lipoprotein [Methylophilus aquaticus]